MTIAIIAVILLVLFTGWFGGWLPYAGVGPVKSRKQLTDEIAKILEKRHD